jgi:hypothetical protein
MWYIPRPRAPAFMTDKISACGHIAASLVKEDTAVMNFGQPFCASDKPEKCRPATAFNDRTPKTRSEGMHTHATDAWALGCLIVEVRGGAPLL